MPSESQCLRNLLVTTPATKQDSSLIPLESSEEPSAAQQAESRIKCPTEFHKNYVKET